MKDIIIVIIGRTGSGKSSFIDKVMTGGMGEGVGHHLTSCTRKVKATRCTFEESGVVLVDTPGFDDTRMSDSDVLKMVSIWLNQKYQRGTTLAAILWFHRITDNHMVEVPLKNLRVFEKLCGKNALPKVILVTTMWDEVDDDVGEERLRELKDTRWKTMILQGSKTHKYMNTRKSAMQLIRPIIHWQQEMTQKGVQLQEETSALGLGLGETISGRELPEDIRREYVEIQVQLDSTLIRARTLRMTKPQRLWQRIQQSLKRM
ncbi:P-loop containing nucleoside triphosphate hydrolase protein [Pisolithus marmoratus]|nr:P-loop containing nucleoside triphosphate hydrolase protein [Pisolithus marmoratus]